MFPLLLPFRLVWLSSFILLFGGGLYTSAALMWAMVSEAFTEEDRYGTCPSHFFV